MVETVLSSFGRKPVPKARNSSFYLPSAGWFNHKQSNNWRCGDMYLRDSCGNQIGSVLRPARNKRPLTLALERKPLPSTHRAGSLSLSLPLPLSLPPHPALLLSLLSLSLTHIHTRARKRKINSESEEILPVNESLQEQNLIPYTAWWEGSSVLGHYWLLLCGSQATEHVPLGLQDTSGLVDSLGLEHGLKEPWVSFYFELRRQTHTYQASFRVRPGVLITS